MQQPPIFLIVAQLADDDGNVHTLRFLADQPPDIETLRGHCRATGLQPQELSTVKLDGEIIEGESTAPIVQTVREFAAGLANIAAPIAVDPTDARLNELERSNRNLVRMVTESNALMAKLHEALVSPLMARTGIVPQPQSGVAERQRAIVREEVDVVVEPEPATPQAVAAHGAGFPLVGAPRGVIQARRARRGLPGETIGETTEMASRTMELVGTIAGSKILQPTVGADGKATIVEQALPRVGSTVKTGSDITGF